MASTLKRVSQATNTTVTALAETQQRTFVAQLDVVVDAGLKALGHDGLPTDEPTPTPASS